MSGFHGLIARIATLFNEGLADYFRICRQWMREQLANPDEDNWLAIWYPASVADMA
ncbi:hypothetical protein [Bifidobacterium simiiventris]|uniref:hypothetical protein n=1 Tax=Bifidobacterium simiiventris TaxID=2834434 RepID=UPI001C563F4F|nr:hypothetical protein [Bifidobacterium simiiventris]MBW3077806.1 hypothetical protein [Bifidobacterium simiiventris]